MTDDPKRQFVIQQAYEVFARYGYSRTTMGDLAQAAGMSRPALYLVFPNKEDLFRAVIGWMSEQGLQQLAAELDALPDLESQLNHACLEWILKGRQLASTYPDAADLFDTKFGGVTQLYDDFRAFLSRLLLRHGRRAAAADDLALLMVTSLKAFKSDIKDETALRSIIALQVSLIAKAR